MVILSEFMTFFCIAVSICPEDGNISSSCFDDSQKFVSDIMRIKYVRFK